MTSITLERLELVLAKKNMRIHKNYGINNLCIYSEIISDELGDSFLMYFPYKYKIEVSRKSNNFVRIQPFEKAEDEPTDDILREGYSEINIQDQKEELGEKEIKDKYRKTINIKKSSNIEIQEINKNKRQLERFGLSIESLKYGLGIFFQKYLFLLSEEGNINIFTSSSETEKRILVIMNIETFLLKIDDCTSELRQLKEGLFDILLKNTNYLSTIIYQSINKLQSISQSTINSKFSLNIERENNKLQSLKTHLSSIMKKEQDINQRIYALDDNKRNDSSARGFYTDIDKINKRKTLENEQDKLRDSKKEIFTNILKERSNIEEKIMSLDSSMFDIAVMLSNVTKSFKN